MLRRFFAFGKKALFPERGLIFQITNRCDSHCLMCFKWKELNKGLKFELSLKEIETLTKQLGNVNSVTLGGGEPFLRTDLPDICRLFEENCGTKHFGIPTNALRPTQICNMVESCLNLTAANFTIGLSIDGVGSLHDEIRGVIGNFDRLNSTYKQLSKNCNIEISANTTISNKNVRSLPYIIDFVSQKMPLVKQHTFEVIRGSFNENNIPPSIIEYEKVIGLEKNPIYKYYHLKVLETLKKCRQVVPCKAGLNMAVIDAVGNVFPCEGLPAVGNIRKQAYGEIWQSGNWKAAKEKIKNGGCYCTHICFLMPSIYASKFELIKLLIYRAKKEALIDG